MALIAADLALAAYMFAAIMFILSLRGLNRPESAKAGNFYGTVASSDRACCC
jgi:NAD/NADP transhydrogenase beta subunit